MPVNAVMVATGVRAALCGLMIFLPFVATGATPDVAFFATPPDVAEVDISPGGRYVAAKTFLNGQYMLVIYDLDNLGKVKPVVASPKDMEVNWLHWKSDQRLLVSLSFADRRYGTATVETRLYGINPDGSDIKFLVPPRRLGKRGADVASIGIEDVVQIADRVVDFLPDDPENILMQFNAADPRLPRIYRVNVFTARRALVKSGMSNVVDWTTDQQGRPRLAHALDDQKMLEQYLYRTPEGKDWEVLWESPLAEGASFAPVLFDRDDPDVAWVRSNHEGDTTGLYRYRFSTRTFLEKVFLNPEVDIGNVLLDPLQRTVVGIRYIVAESRVHWLDSQIAALVEDVLLRIGAKHLYIHSWSEGYRKIIFYGESPDLPGRYYLYDRETKDLKYFAYAYPRLEDVPMAPMRNTSYQARDGLQIPAYLSLPPGITTARPATPLPAIVMPHGGPTSRDFSSFDTLVQMFTSRGYAVLQMNYRGSWGYGYEFRSAGHREWGQAMQDDVTDGTRWLASEGIADPQRTCIVGWNYGGYAALMGAVKEPNLYACVVSIAGVSDLRALINSKRNYLNSRIWTRNIGEGWKDRKSLEDNSPVNGAKRIQAPVLLAHGTDDRAVPIKQTTDMVKALDRAGKSYEYIELKGADHSVRRGPERLKLFTAVDKFVTRNLGSPTPSPAPGDPAP